MKVYSKKSGLHLEKFCQWLISKASQANNLLNIKCQLFSNHRHFYVKLGKKTWYSIIQKLMQFEQMSSSPESSNYMSSAVSMNLNFLNKDKFLNHDSVPLLWEWRATLSRYAKRNISQSIIMKLWICRYIVFVTFLKNLIIKKCNKPGAYG